MNTKNSSVNTKKSLPKNVNNSNQELFSTKQIAEQLHTSSKVVLANAKKCLKNKVFENGKTTYFSKGEVTVIIEQMKSSNPNQNTFTAAVKAVSTELTPALMIKQAMELAQKGYELELKRIEAEKNRIAKERDVLQIKLDESKEWYTIKRMQKLNPDIEFKYSLLRKESKRLGYEIIKVPDSNYGEVNSYHKAVFESLYFDTLNYGD